MKCKMVRFHTMTKPPEHHSRAKRAVLLNHFEVCAKCRKWLDTLPDYKLSPEEEKRIDQEMDDLLDADLKDPEFVAIVDHQPHPVLQGPHNRTGSR
jgi:hypothetical protein